jgi:succinoglycan biosynthesis protein ExoA
MTMRTRADADQQIQSADVAGGRLATVVVPALNEERHIRACLESVLSQTYHDLQVLVVDGGSTDHTADIVNECSRSDRRVRLLTNPGGGIPRSLNFGLQAAQGRYLIRIDAHSVVPTDYIATVVDLLRGGRWAGVGARKDAQATTATGRAIARALGSPFGVGNSVYHHGTTEQAVDHIPFGAYPTELVRRLGGWNEDLTANEDYELDYRIRRAGGRLLFTPQMRIDWCCRESIGELFKQYRRYGRGKATVARLHPLSIKPRHVAPPLLVAFLLVTGVGSLRRPSMILATAPYVAFLGIAAAQTGSENDCLRTRAALPAAFATMHVAWGIGFWSGVAHELAKSKRRA